MQGVQFRVNVRDKDSGNDNQEIGAFSSDINLRVNESTDITLQSQTTSRAVINMNIRVLCAQNFQGSDCTQCVSGFTGAMCDVNTDDCTRVNCSGNGQCADGINSFTCDCIPGFTGAEC